MDAARILSGDRRSLARGLSVIEDGGKDAIALLDQVWKQTGRARRLGITGPPGAGKSTLVAGLTTLLRAEGKTVGIIAVDPTSPFTGGALLGDRHRMTREASDDGVFLRSLASRGSLGGLSRAAPASLDLLDAAGFDVLILETVGVGQSEVEVAATADTVVVVLSPESGDAVQAMKAGLIEIADVLCVNKADRDGAAELIASLEAMLDLKENATWRPPAVATTGTESAAPLLEGIEKHANFLEGEDRLANRRRTGMAARLRALVASMIAERMLANSDEVLAAQAKAVEKAECSVLHAAERVVEEILG